MKALAIFHLKERRKRKRRNELMEPAKSNHLETRVRQHSSKKRDWR
jgi:hypothetical protein